MDPDILWHPPSLPWAEKVTPTSGYAHSPFGTMHLLWTGNFLLEAGFEEYNPDHAISSSAQKLADLIVSRNPLPIRPLAIGTPFQLRVWQALTRIPYGTTASYQEIAKAINSPKASRAVGSAIGANRLALLIPCHRVIRSDGQIGGFGWGIPTKQKILTHEHL
jgi:O-6-methylguanine DNA methyltransferase